MERYIVGITGASGSIYGIRLIEELLKKDCEVFLTITKTGLLVIKEEMGLDLTSLTGEEAVQSALRSFFKDEKERLTYYDIGHIGASIASGSFRAKAMVVLPCSMGTASSIASGASNNLLERSADVMLKEGKPLLVVPRETPFSIIHLENLLKIAKAGGKVIPAMPGFYFHPQTIDDMVYFLVGRILDQLGVDNDLFKRWEG